MKCRWGSKLAAGKGPDRTTRLADIAFQRLPVEVELFPFGLPFCLFTKTLGPRDTGLAEYVPAIYSTT